MHKTRNIMTDMIEVRKVILIIVNKITRYSWWMDWQINPPIYTLDK